MKLNSHERLRQRFIAFVLLQAILICLAIFLSINYFGSDIWTRRNGVGLILASPREAAGWPRDMSQGLQRACEEHGYNLYIEDEVKSDDDSLTQVTEKLVKKGVKKIFLANPGYQANLENIARKYPQVDFYANSVGEAISNRMYNYSVRYYEVRYLAGLLAGLHTRSGIVGYMAPFPALETRRDLNAFALGVQKMRPDARVIVQWTGQWISPDKENKALYILKHAGADVVTYFAASQHPAQEAASLGLDYIDFHGGGLSLPPHCIATIETDWRAVYGKLLHTSSHKSASKIYWQGMLDNIGGSWVCPKADISAHNFDKITALCKEARKALLGFEVAHIGINTDGAEIALGVAEKFDEAFGFGVKQGNSSNFAGSGVEVMKSQYLGEKGHLAVRTNKMDCAIPELESRGFKVDMETAKYKGDRLNAVYLKDEIGGFAVHLLQK